MAFVPQINKRVVPPKSKEPSGWDYAGMIGLPLAIGALTGGVGGLALGGMNLAGGLTATQAMGAGAALGGISGAGQGATTAAGMATALPVTPPPQVQTTPMMYQGAPISPTTPVANKVQGVDLISSGKAQQQAK